MKQMQYKIFIALSYFFYYALLSLEFTYVPSYLIHTLGFQGVDISLIFGGIPLVGILAQLFWGEIADRSRKTGRIIRINCTLAILFSLPLIIWHPSKALICIVFWILSFLLTSISALLDTIALSRWEMKTYGIIRSWGSLGYGIAALLFPYQYLNSIILFVFATICLLWGCNLFIGEEARNITIQENSTEDTNFKFINLLKNHKFLFLVIFGVIHSTSSGAYNLILDVHRTNMGLMDSFLFFGKSFNTTGMAIAIGIVSEFIFMAIEAFLVKHWGARLCLLLCAGLTGIRWACMSYDMGVIGFVGLQAFHGLSFGLFYVSCLSCLVIIVPNSMRATGQTLFSGIVFSVSNLIGIVLSGLLLDSPGRGFWAFGVMAFISMLATILSLFLDCEK